MYVTSSFVGTTIGRNRLLFFLLYEGYNDPQRSYVKELQIYLERFARDLQESAAIVKPFDPDIESTREHVVEKPWTRQERRELADLPGLLVIDQDFDTFTPREHPWIFLKFTEAEYGPPERQSRIGQMLREIAESVRRDPIDDIFGLLRDLTSPAPSLGDLFEIKPGVFGMSIDVKRAGSSLRRILRERNSSGSGQ